MTRQDIRFLFDSFGSSASSALEEPDVHWEREWEIQGKQHVLVLITWLVFSASANCFTFHPSNAVWLRSNVVVLCLWYLFSKRRRVRLLTLPDKDDMSQWWDLVVCTHSKQTWRCPREPIDREHDRWARRGDSPMMERCCSTWFFSMFHFLCLWKRVEILLPDGLRKKKTIPLFANREQLYIWSATSTWCFAFLEQMNVVALIIVVVSPWGSHESSGKNSADYHQSLDTMKIEENETFSSVRLASHR